MRLYGRLVFITIIYCSARLNEAKEQRGRHLFSLFGFISDKQDLRSKHIVYSPVIIVPLLTQEQNAFIKESSANENYQENGEVLQQSTAESNNTDNSASVKGVKEDLEHGENNEEIQAEETSDSFRVTNNVTDVIAINDMKQNLVENTTTTINFPETNTENVTESQPSDEATEKSYPTAVYNNEFIKSVTLTTGPPTFNNDFVSILPVNNENWKNFKNNSDEYLQKGGWFGGRELSFPTDNRWRKFSLPLSYFSSEFRPIAGLYHDGFLHRPLLNRYGFIPSRQVYD